MSEHNEQRASGEAGRAWRPPHVTVGHVLSRVVSDRRGASMLELLIVVAIVALGGMAAMRTLSGAMSDAAGGQQKAIAALSAVGGGSAPGDARPSSPPPPPPAPPKPAPKKDDGGWGLPGWVKDVGSFALDLTPLGDIKTLMDPDASLFDKVLAGTSLATSVIPGVGQAVKGVTTAVKIAKRVDKAAEGIDKAKDIDKARDAAKAGDEPLDVSGAPKRKKPDEGEDPKNKPDEEECPGGKCENKQCFAAGTLVHTEQGDRPIESIQVGERVWSRDPSTFELALRPVTKTFVSRSRVMDLAISSGDRSEPLTVTPEHPFWTREHGWVGAAELDQNLELWSPSSALTAAGAVSRPEQTTVYNLEVADFHTYFVGSLHAWVHNRCEKRMKQHEECFKRNPAHDAEEFEEQLLTQEEGLNELTVEQFLKNRDKFKASGRAHDPSQAAELRRVRQELEDDMYEHLLADIENPSDEDKALARKQAVDKADRTMRTMAALHNADQIAGGGMGAEGVGDRRVNSSLGSQWKTRIDALERAARAVPESERGSTLMNVSLFECP